MSAGQEETLQEGFDRGYREAAQVAFAVGRLQGQIRWVAQLSGVIDD